MPRNGNGAGNPMAAVLFALAYVKVISRRRRELHEQGLPGTCPIAAAAEFISWSTDLHTIPTGFVSLDDVSYADDLVLTVVAGPEKVSSATQKLAGTVWKFYSIAGFRMDFGLGETIATI